MACAADGVRSVPAEPGTAKPGPDAHDAADDHLIDPATEGEGRDLKAQLFGQPFQVHRNGKLVPAPEFHRLDPAVQSSVPPKQYSCSVLSSLRTAESTRFIREDSARFRLM